ncbi:MAG: hypothetical protein ACHQ1D_00770 [Nitrososphaerales archaeon]
MADIIDRILDSVRTKQNNQGLGKSFVDKLLSSIKQSTPALQALEFYAKEIQPRSESVRSSALRNVIKGQAPFDADTLKDITGERQTEFGDIAREDFGLEDKGIGLSDFLTPGTIGAAAVNNPGATIGLGAEMATDPLNFLAPEAIAGKLGKLSKVGAKVTEEAVAKAAAKQTVVPETLVGRLAQKIREAKPARAEQEILFSEERAKRVAKAAEVSKTTKGESGFRRELSQLKGELPKKSNFESIRSTVTDDEVTELMEQAKNHPDLDYFETVNTRSALGKMFEGKIPTESELVLLEKVYGRNLVSALESKQSLFQKAVKAGVEVGNFSRAVRSSYDVSFPLRQGLFFSSRPEFYKSFKPMFESLIKESAFKDLQNSLKVRPTFDLMKKAGVDFTDINTTLAKKEESFMSKFAEKIPGVKHSNRAFVAFGNKLRADVFDSIYKQSLEQGIDLANDPKALSDLGKYINAATGRGELPDAIARVAPLLNSTFFSPKLISSRLTLLNPATYVGMEPVIRKQALRDLAGTSGLLTTILGLAAMGGADVESDPRSSDFAKIKVGNTRYDIGGGFQQYIRLFSQLLSNETKSVTTGEVKKLGEGFGSKNRVDLVNNFLSYKMAPATALALSLVRGKDIFGQDLEVDTEAQNLFVPMVLQDVLEMVEEHGVAGIPMSLPVFFGAGAQTFDVEKRRAEEKAKKLAEAESPQGKSKEAIRRRDIVSGLFGF